MKPKNIKILLTDVDGVLTDGGMYYTPNGDTMKKFHARDGMGVNLLKKSGVPTIIITKEKTKMVKNWAKKMNISYIYDGIQEKEKLNAIQKANEYAIEIPLEVISHCLRIIELSEKLIDNGNPNLVSDAGVSAEVSLAGVRGAAMNVLINLIGIDDDSYCNKKRKLVHKLINDAEKNWKIVFDKTMKKIIL